MQGYHRQIAIRADRSCVSAPALETLEVRALLSAGAIWPMEASPWGDPPPALHVASAPPVLGTTPSTGLERYHLDLIATETIDFEAPTYALANLNGQDGWVRGAESSQWWVHNVINVDGNQRVLLDSSIDPNNSRIHRPIPTGGELVVLDWFWRPTHASVNQIIGTLPNGVTGVSWAHYPVRIVMMDGGTFGTADGGGWQITDVPYDLAGHQMRIVYDLRTAGSVSYSLYADGQMIAEGAAAMPGGATVLDRIQLRANQTGGQEVDDIVVSVYNVLGENAWPVIEDQTFDVDENSPAGTVVGTVIATDSDAGQTLMYAIITGNESGFFQIDSASGTITVAHGADLDFESVAQYVLTVQVTDDGWPVLSSSATISIDLNDVNEPPVVADQSFSVDENAPAGTVVGAVVATDPDAGQTLTYAITSGNESGFFQIDSASGVITVAGGADLDFETVAQYVLTVQVTDDGWPVLSSSATVTIDLNDVNEAPAIAPVPGSVQYVERSGAAALLSNLVVTDPEGILTGAQVSIGSGFAPGEDVLGFVPGYGIEGYWDAASGVLTLWGTATVEQWQAVLRGVTYRNDSFDPSAAPRRVVLSVDDGQFEASVEMDLLVVAVNDPPRILGPTTAWVQAGLTTVFTGSSRLLVEDPDAGSAVVEVWLEASTGVLTLGTTDGLTFLEGSGEKDATLRFQGTLGAVNAALDGLVFHAPRNADGMAQLRAVVDDLGNTGLGGAAQDELMVAIFIEPAPVEPEPVAPDPVAPAEPVAPLPPPSDDPEPQPAPTAPEPSAPAEEPAQDGTLPGLPTTGPTDGGGSDAPADVPADTPGDPPADETPPEAPPEAPAEPADEAPAGTEEEPVAVVEPTDPGGDSPADPPGDSTADVASDDGAAPADAAPGDGVAEVPADAQSEPGADGVADAGTDGGGEHAALTEGGRDPASAQARAAEPVTLHWDLEGAGQYAEVIANEAMWQEIIQAEEQVRQRAAADAQIARVVIGTSTGAVTFATAGYMIWAVKGGTVLATWLSLGPVLRLLDPLPILDYAQARHARKRRRREGPKASEPGKIEEMVD